VEATGKTLMGHIQFLNQDGDWEEFPNEEQRANLIANAQLLEELGYKLICQLCNTVSVQSRIGIKVNSLLCSRNRLLLGCHEISVTYLAAQ